MDLESDLAKVNLQLKITNEFKLFFFKLRVICEIVILVGSLLYLLTALREAKFLGYKMFIENLVSACQVYFLLIFKIIFKYFFR